MDSEQLENTFEEEEKEPILIKIDHFTVDASKEPSGTQFNSIQDAIDKADQGAIIKIAGGEYIESININKPNITLKAASDQDKVNISNIGDQMVRIQMGEDETCQIQNINFTFTIHQQSSLAQDEAIEDVEEVDRFRDLINDSLQISPEMSSVIMLQSGRLDLSNVTISYDQDTKCGKCKMPSIIALEGAWLKTTDCTIQGARSMDVISIGMLLIKPKYVKVDKCQFAHHHGGGVMMRLKDESAITMSESQVLACETVGIFIQGPNEGSILTKNEVKFCRASGLHIGSESNVKVSENGFMNNDTGIEITDNSSELENNIIEKSFENGVVIRSQEGSIQPCVPHMNSNSITDNKANGIMIYGKMCEPEIVRNKIQNNDKCGIKLVHLARAKIYDENVIYKNLNQGILLVEGCSALIKDNTIFKSAKANIGFGGLQSGLTRIQHNTITHSQAEGIFVVEGDEKVMICENTISENQDGVVMLNSKGEIHHNNIQSNVRSGVYVTGKSHCQITLNKIKNNQKGLWIKDYSLPEVTQNTIKDNKHQISTDNYVKLEMGTVKSENKISGPNDLPRGKCVIF